MRPHRHVSSVTPRGQLLDYHPAMRLPYLLLLVSSGALAQTEDRPGSSAETAMISGISGDVLKFTDVVLLGLETHFSLGGKAELGAGTAILPKQPSTADENVWQG